MKTAISLDIDDGLTWDDACQRFEGQSFGWLAHTTYSYDPQQGDKFRVLIPLATPIPSAQYSALWQWANDLLGGNIDPATKDASRMYYLPAIRTASAPYRHASQITAPLLDWRALNLDRFNAKPFGKAKPKEPATNANGRLDKYALAALQDERGKVGSASPGARNDILNRAAFALGQFIPIGLLDEAMIRIELTQAAEVAGLKPAEIAATLASGIEAGKQQPRQLPEAKPMKSRGEATEPQPARPIPVEEKPDGKNKEPELKWTAEGYAATTSGMKYLRTRKGENTTGGDEVNLCNFNARILSEVIEDDGVETRSCYEIEATLAGDSVPRRVTIPASEYTGMKWLDDVVGVKGMIFPGKGEYVRCAIKSRSQDAVIKRAIAHTGLRYESGTAAYYTSSGAIGANGLIAAEVKLPADFAAYSLPAPPQGTNRIAAVNASLTLLDLAGDEITIPMQSAPAAAIIGGTDYSHHATGISGAHKSCWVALLLNHFGADFRYDHLTGHWQQDTAIALLTKTHIAKDAPLVIDDFKPQKSKQETEKMVQKAEFVLRAQANRAGRGRAMTDGGLRTTKAPRGLVVSTGEDVPPGESLRARLVITEIGKGDIDIAKLTIAQKQARAGVFAQATSSFIQWLATDNLISKLIARRDDDVEIWRDFWLAQTSSAHKRHANNLAHITYSWRLWLNFATEAGALTKPAAETLWKDRILPALEKCGANQAKWLVSENPADRFIDLLRAALSSGAAHLAYADGKRPDSDIALACGWRDDHPQGVRIGFVDEDGIYLIPDSVYEVVSGFGEGITVTQTILWKRLFEGGKILRDEVRGTFKIRKTISQSSPDFVILKRNFLL